MANGGFKDLTRKTGSRKILLEKAYHIAKNPKYDGCQGRFTSIVYLFLIKKASSSGIKNKNISDQRPLDLVLQELTEELHKPIT